MFVTYHPQGSDTPTRWEFKPGKVRNARASMIEKLYGKAIGQRATYKEFEAAVQQGAATARRVLLWHLQSIDHPNLRLDDVDFCEDEMLVEFSREELTEFREGVAAAAIEDEAQRALMLGALDAQIATAESDGGKAQSTTSLPSTGSTSPQTSTSDPENSTS